MNYQEAIEYIHDTYRFGSKLGLQNIRRLLEKLGNPEKDLRVIHVAGTNGKGSVCSMLQSILTEAGYRTGLYTSPYIQSFNERIRIGNTMIPDEDLASITSEIKQAVDSMLQEGHPHPTEFEVVTAIGFQYFLREKVDVLILEVGLGGRGDSTNVIKKPLASVITPVDYDHMDQLGDSLEAIAGEKAGIIKQGCPVIVGKQDPKAMKVIKKTAEEKNAPYYSALPEKLIIHESLLQGQNFSVILNGVAYDQLRVALPGLHQVDNCLLVLKTLQVLQNSDMLQISDQALRSGLEKVRWMGRLEILQHNPLFIIDGAHNIAGARSLAGSIQLLLPNQKVTFITGMLSDKDIKGILRILIPHMNQVVVTKPDSQRALPAETLATMIRNDYGQVFTQVYVAPTAREAVDKAFEITPIDGAIICAGSLYLLGEVRKRVLRGNETDHE